jgi:Do/DeqQ family serine protease
MRSSRPARRLTILWFAICACCALPTGSLRADEPAVPSSREQITLSFAPLVKQVEPAVVNIYTRAVVQQRASPLFNDPFFRQFFGDAFGQPSQRVQNSLGSGVIVRSDGLVVTNVHVIEGAQEIKVVLSDGREFSATPVTSDDQSDLALLKVDPEGATLPVLPLGDSDALEVGDLVLAIGNPFGVGQTVTSGIVSALARTRVGISDYGFFIQTDAAINPGNSGGALINMAGQLIGINTAIYSRSGGSIGIGFAIPSNMVHAFVEAAKAGRDFFERPYIGAQFEPVTPQIAESLGMDAPAGALVTSVEDNGPAAKAGLKPGDVVLKMNGTVLESVDALGYRLATQSIGAKATFDVLSKGKQQTLDIVLERAPEGATSTAVTLHGRSPFSGAQVAELSPRLAQRLGMRTDLKGVTVVGVDSGSPAAANRLGPVPRLARVVIRRTRQRSAGRRAGW